jgi:transketolase
VPIIALHLTRPNVKVPDRAALGIPSHFDAAKGAYVIRDFDPKRPKEGTLIVQGTSTTESLYALLPRFAKGEGPNVKLVAGRLVGALPDAAESYRDSVAAAERLGRLDLITNGARRLMHDWLRTRSPRSTRCRATGTTAGAPAATSTSSRKKRTSTPTRSGPAS